MAEVTQQELDFARRSLSNLGGPTIEPLPEDRTHPAYGLVQGMGGRREWSDPDIPLQQRAADFLQTHAVMGTSDWRQIAAEGRQHFPGVDLAPAARGYEQQMNLSQARQRYRDWVPNTLDIAGRQSLPFVSTVFSAAERQWAADAERRLAAGRPQQADYDILARSQRLTSLYENAGFGAEVSRTIAGLPAIAGEMAFASGGVGVAQRVAPRVFGAAAAEGAVAARPAMALGSAGQWGARTALTTAAPSMWAPQAVENAVANGGTWSELRNLGPAYATGFVNTAVIGSVQRFGGRGALGLVSKAALGVGEQAIADVATGWMNQRLGLQNANYGLAADALEGKWGKLLQHASLQALTFAMLGALHHEWGPRNPVAEATERLMAEQRRQEVPPEEAARVLIESQLPVVEAMRRNPDLTQAQAREAAQAAPEGPRRAVAEAMAQAVPTELQVRRRAKPGQVEERDRGGTSTESGRATFKTPAEANAWVRDNPGWERVGEREARINRREERGMAPIGGENAGAVAGGQLPQPGVSGFGPEVVQKVSGHGPAEAGGNAGTLRIPGGGVPPSGTQGTSRIGARTKPGPTRVESPMTPEQAAAALAAEQAKPPARPTVVGARQAAPKVAMESRVEAQVQAAGREAMQHGMAGPVASAYAWNKVLKDYPSPSDGKAAAHAHAVAERLYGPRPKAPEATPSPPAAPGAARPPEPAQAPPAPPQAAERPANAWNHTGTEFRDRPDGTFEFTGRDGKTYHLVAKSVAPDVLSHAPNGRSEVYVYNADGKEVGHVHFYPTKNPGVWHGEGLSVEPQARDAKERRTGVAGAMYDFVNHVGEHVVPAEGQTPEGKRFWERNRQLGIKQRLVEPEHLPAFGPEPGIDRPVEAPPAQVAQPAPAQLKPPVPVQLHESPAKVAGHILHPNVIGSVVDAVAGQLTPLQAKRLRVVLTDPRSLDELGRTVFGGVSKQAVESMVNPLWKKLQAADPRLAAYETLNDFRKAQVEANKTDAPNVESGTKFEGLVERAAPDTTEALIERLDNPTPDVGHATADVVRSLVLHARNTGQPIERVFEREAPELVAKVGRENMGELIRLSTDFHDAVTKDAAAHALEPEALRREIDRVLRGEPAAAEVPDSGEGSQAAEPGQAAQGPAEAALGGQAGEPAGPPAPAERGTTPSDILTPQERTEAHEVAKANGDSVEAVEAALAGVDLAARQQEAEAARLQAAQSPAAAREARLERARRKQAAAGAITTPGGAGPGGPRGVAFPQAPTERAGVGGGQEDAAAPQQPQRTAALANAQVELQRAALDLDRLEAAGVLPNRQVRDQAFAMLQADPEAGAKLVQELSTNMRPTSVVENALMLQRMVALRNEYDRVISDYNAESMKPKAARDSAKLDTLEASERALLGQIDQLDHVSNRTGTETARSLQFRRQLMAQDYSLGGMVAAAERAAGRRLTGEERSRIEELQAKIKELQDQLAGMEDRGEVKPGSPSDVGFRLTRHKTQFAGWVAEYRRSTAPWHVKALGYLGEAFNLPRSVMASIDFPFLRQGLIGFVTHPVISTKAAAESVKSFFSEEVAQRSQYNLDTRPNAPLYKESGLDLTGHPGGPREEGFLSRLAEKIPGVGHVLRGSERSYQTFLNRLRADVFDHLAGSLSQGGKLTSGEARVIANYVNVMTGRGPLGGAEKAATVLSQLFFAPKWTVSRFQFLLGQPLYSNFGENAPRARQLVAKEYARFAAGMGVAVGLAALAGLDLEKDPRSPNFGKLQVGNTRLDFTGGLAGTARLLAQTMTLSTKNQRGQVVPLSGRLPFGQDNYADVLARYTRGKLAPVPGAALDLLSGTDVVGQPVTPTSRAGGLATPLYARDVYEAMQDLGVPKGTAVSLLGLLGMSMTTYDPNAPRQPLTPEERQRQQEVQRTRRPLGAAR